MTSTPIQAAMESLATSMGTKLKAKADVTALAAKADASALAAKADASTVSALATRVTAAETALSQTPGTAPVTVDMGPILAALD